MKNYLQEGETLSLTMPYDRTSGQGVKVGSVFGVVVVTALQNVVAPVKRKGVFTLTKETGAGWTEGQVLYWDDTNKRVTHTSAGNTKIGVAAAAAASGDATGSVSIGFFVP